MAELISVQRIAVGDPQVKPDRIRATYDILRRGQKTVRVRLDIKYPEPVLDPDSQPHRGLARLIALAPLVNLAPFAQRIDADFPLDPVDVRFLEELFRAVSKDILINRLYGGDGELVDRAALPPFDPKPKAGFGPLEVHARVVPGAPVNMRYEESAMAVLLDGSAASLLAAGLFESVGASPHGLMVTSNTVDIEVAKRTARFLAKREIPCHEVTTNLDSVLTGLAGVVKPIATGPGKKKDWGSLACLKLGLKLLAAMPLLRAKRIGALGVPVLNPGELPSPFEGVAHYGGRYERSRYFLDLLTQYLRIRGPKIEVFAPVTPLGEVAAVRVLGERFPEWFSGWIPSPEAQAAAVKKGSRKVPCPWALGLLLALGIDPARANFTVSDVKALMKNPGDLFDADPEVRAFVVDRLGDLGWDLSNGVAADDELLAVDPEFIRFDNRLTFTDTIPLEHRREIYATLLDVLPGTLVLSGDHWTRFDLLASAELSREKELFGRNLEGTP